MKKWMYVIFPASLLAIFLFFYSQSMSELNRREQARAAEIAAQKAADAQHKRIIEEKARQDAEKRAIEQAAETARIEKEKEAKWNADSKKLQDQIDRATAEADEYSKKASDLEIELDALNKRKEQANREDFDLLKRVENARVAQQTAELEVQRMVAMIAKRAEESSMAQMPPPPPKQD